MCVWAQLSFHADLVQEQAVCVVFWAKVVNWGKVEVGYLLFGAVKTDFKTKLSKTQKIYIT